MLRNALRRLSNLARRIHPIAPTIAKVPHQGPPAEPAGYDDPTIYRDHVASLKNEIPDFDSAMQKSIGGEFEAMGIMERELLVQHGLKKDGFVIDVGCGAGRLALPLSDYLGGGELLRHRCRS